MSAEVIGSAAFEIRALNRTGRDMDEIQRELDGRLTAIERSYGIAGRDAARSFNAGQRQIVDQAKVVEREMRGSSDRIADYLRNAAGAIAAGVSVREITQLADSYTRFTNNLRVAGVEGAALNKVQETLFASAQRNGVQIEALSTLYGRASQAASNLGASQADLLKFTDGVTNALRIQGGDPAAASGALLQLSQALQSGTVRAEEFNSVNEGAFPILQAVAAGSERFGGSVAKLRQEVIAGTVSSREFFESFLTGSATLEERAAKAALTTGQAMTVLQNALTQYVGEADKGLGASQALGSAINSVAQNLDTLIPALAVLATGLGVGMVTRAVAAQVAVAGLTGSLTALRTAALAAFGGPIGLAITAITVAIGAFAIEGANASAAARNLEAAMDSTATAIATADSYAGNASTKVRELGGEATSAGGKVNRFAGEVGNAAQQLWELARAKKAAALADLETERVELSRTLASNIQRSPEQRRQDPFGRKSSAAEEWRAGSTYIAGEVRNWWTGGASDRENADAIAAGRRQLAEIDAAAARLRALPEADFVDEVRRDRSGGIVASAPTSDAKKEEDNTAQEALQRQRQYEDELARVQSDTLRSHGQMAVSARERASNAIMALDLDAAARKTQLDRLQDDGEITALQRQELEAADRALRLSLEANVAREYERDALAEQVDATRQLSEFTAGLLQIRSGMAETASERLDLELQLLDLHQQERRAALERIATSKDVSEAQRKAAQTILDGLAEQEDAERGAVRANNRTPMQRWRAESPDTPAKMQEALENIAANGLDKLNDGITDAIMNAKDLGEVFSQVSRQIISDLIAIGVRRSITDPLANLLFPSGDKVGGGGPGIFASIGRLFGFAGGGHVEGPGTGTSDSILARLSNGEFVVNARQTAKYRPLLETINRGVAQLPGFANGGMVDGPIWASEAAGETLIPAARSEVSR